jgi:1-aminocyclopropane-1-carboxylate synthase
MASHINEYFRPTQQLDAENITFAAGVTALNEACALALCDPGDAILLGQYNYGAFPTDLVARTG